MERKHTGKIIALFALLFLSSFGETIEQLARMDTDYDTATGYGLLITLANIGLISVIMMIVPFIARLVNKGKLPYKSGKRLCLWNSIILFIISSVMLVLTEVNFIGGVGAIVFYFINKWIFVSDLQPSVQPPVATDVPYVASATVSTTAHPTHICLSAEGELQNTYGNYHVRASDLMLENNTELPKAAPVQPAPQPKVQPVQHYAPAAGQPTKYCSCCGNAIDPATKKCRGCGKQYFKGVSWKAVLTTMAIIVFLLSFAGNFILCFTNIKLNKALEEAQSDSTTVSSLQKSNNELSKEILELRAEIAGLKEDKSELQSQIREYTSEIAFYDEFVVFVEDDGTNLYHNYDCYKFKAEGFWAFNIDAAKDEGYKPCSLCCD